MSAADMIAVGCRLPRIRSVAFHSDHEVTVAWAEATRDESTEVVDLAPLVFRMAFYVCLRDDDALRRSVHVVEDGAAIAWGEADEIDMSAGSVLRLAEEARATARPIEEVSDAPRSGARIAAA